MRGRLILFVRARLEWFWRQIAAGLLHQNFHSAFRLLELLLAIARKHHAFLEKFHGVVQRKICVLEFAHNFFQPRERLLELGLLSGGLGPFPGSGIQTLLRRLGSILAGPETTGNVRQAPERGQR